MKTKRNYLPINYVYFQLPHVACLAQFDVYNWDSLRIKGWISYRFQFNTFFHVIVKLTLKSSIYFQIISLKVPSVVKRQKNVLSSLGSPFYRVALQWFNFRKLYQATPSTLIGCEMSFLAPDLTVVMFWFLTWRLHWTRCY